MMHTCPQCRSKFTQKSSLQTHMKSIHQVKMYTCPQCSNEFVQKQQLRLHIQSNHDAISGHNVALNHVEMEICT